MSKLLKDAAATFNELLRMHQLNQELLETLVVTMTWVKDYAEKHNIPLLKESAYVSLIFKAQTLIEEIASKDEVLLSDDFLHRKKSDKDFKEHLPQHF